MVSWMGPIEDRAIPGLKIETWGTRREWKKMQEEACSNYFVSLGRV
jgi:hypothetical protein